MASGIGDAEEKGEVVDLPVNTDAQDGHNASKNAASDDQTDDAFDETPSKYERSWVNRALTPKNCRWDDKAPPPFTMPLCLLFALASTFTVANLYYNQPILNRIADTFNVSHEESAQVATLLQAGYAVGLIFVLPLGDMLERRMFIISLVAFTAALWIGLCVTPSFTAFRALSFICGVTTVTPQLMIPLVGDFAPPERRGLNLSIVVSGLMSGMLIARFLSGVVSNFTSWRNIYWFACGAQFLLSLCLYLFMPDYPSKNPDGLNYFRALWSIPCIMVQEPLLIQACLMVFAMSCVFTTFWTTLTFLLSSAPYEYSTLTIGLFSLLTLPAIVSVPLFGKMIDKFVPHLSILIGELIVGTGLVIGTFISNMTVAGPIIQGVCTDLGVQIVQVANRSAIFGIRPKARNRVNTAYMATAFVGQLTGTAVGNRLYAMGGWRASGGCSIGFFGFALVCLLARGPRETRWVGWRGGWRLRRDSPAT